MGIAQFMGLLIFLAGLVMVVVSALSTVVPVGTIGDLERVVLFVAGVLTLVIGYYMAQSVRPSI